MVNQNKLFSKVKIILVYMLYSEMLIYIAVGKQILNIILMCYSGKMTFVFLCLVKGFLKPRTVPEWFGKWLMFR